MRHSTVLVLQSARTPCPTVRALHYSCRKLVGFTLVAGTVLASPKCTQTGCWLCYVPTWLRIWATLVAHNIRVPRPWTPSSSPGKPSQQDSVAAPRYSFLHTSTLLSRRAFLCFEGRRSASEGRCGSRLSSNPYETSCWRPRLSGPPISTSRPSWAPEGAFFLVFRPGCEKHPCEDAVFGNGLHPCFFLKHRTATPDGLQGVRSDSGGYYFLMEQCVYLPASFAAISVQSPMRLKP
jgi:hypothetical protein